MNSTIVPSRRRFDRLVPFYLTGRIAPDDRAWVEQYLIAHPGAGAELDWHRDLMTEVVAKAEARAMQAPESVGWARVQAELRATRPAPSTTWAERLHGWFGWLAARPLAPIAAVVILVQGGAIGTLMSRSPDEPPQATRSVASAAARDVLQVSFKQAATEHALRALLYGAGARIVDGPDQLGDYVVEPRRGPLAALQTQLEGSELVQRVTLLKAWKADPRED